MTKRTEITVETHRLLIVRKRRAPARTWCGSCLAEVELVSPDEAAAALGVSSRRIYRWIEEGALHFMESAGILAICANSLTANHDGGGDQ